MTWRIDEIEIENLKFYCKPFFLKLKGQNALIFGENGAGKSSIYWSVYTHFQAAFKTLEEAGKYFISENPQNLRNRFSSPENYSGIRISVLNGMGGSHTYEDSNEQCFAADKTDRKFIEISARTSDFLNYKLVSSIFDFKNSEDNDIFNILRKEIFPLLDFPKVLQDLDNNEVRIEDTKVMSIDGWWSWLNTFESILPRNVKKPATFNKSHPKYKIFEKRLKDFDSELLNILNFIFGRANAIIKDKFEIPVRLGFEYVKSVFNEMEPGRRKTRTGKLIRPKVIIKAIYDAPGVKDISEVRHPKSFFNEAKLACMGIAFRLAVLEQRAPVETGVGVLLLDDVMHSLDMGVRRMVVPLLLDYQNQWQMIVMTHDIALYNLFKTEQEKRNQNIEWKNENLKEKGQALLPLERWCYLQLFSIEEEGKCPKPLLIRDNSLREEAARHLKMCRIPECANSLRRYCEQQLKRILPHNLKYTTKEFSEKTLYGLLEAFRDFFIDECKIQSLHDLYLHLQGDRIMIFNPFSHNNIETPFYRNELKYLIHNLQELEQIQMKNILPISNDIHTGIYKMYLKKVVDDNLFSGWVTFKFKEFLCEVKYDNKKYYSNPKVILIDKSDKRIKLASKNNKEFSLRQIYRELRMYLSLPDNNYGPEIIEKWEQE